MTIKQFSLAIATAALTVVVIGKAQAPSGANPVFEYRTIALLDTVDGYGEAQLNKAGREGWELVAVRVVIANQEGQAGVAYLKRRK